MTNSGKWAHYAPGNMGVDVVLATLDECVQSATTGVVTWDRELFT
jgi:predicted aconitase